MDDFFTKTLPAWLGLGFGLWGLLRQWATSRPFVWVERSGDDRRGDEPNVFHIAIKNNASAPIVLTHVGGLPGRHYKATLTGSTEMIVRSVVVGGIEDWILPPGTICKISVTIEGSYGLWMVFRWRSLHGMGAWQPPVFLFKTRATLDRLIRASSRSTADFED
jgi:hypothetical protein